MREITDLLELQIILKGILSRFADYCDKYNLTYCLYGGTLLGAVRHGDIIPWDDDIDVCMPRPDYEKLIKLQSYCKIPECTVFGPWINNYIYPYLKVSLDGSKVVEKYLQKKYNIFGCYLDVFPIDGRPKNYNERQFKSLYNKLYSLKLKKAIVCGNYSTIPNIIHKSYHYARRWWETGFKSYKYYLNKLLEIPQKKEFDYSDSEESMCLYSAYVKKFKIPKATFSDLELYQFGDRKYPAVKNYDIYLTQLYGDYMKLPPEEKRISLHNADFYVE